MNGFIFSPVVAQQSRPAIGLGEQTPLRCGPVPMSVSGSFETLADATAAAREQFGAGLEFQVYHAADGRGALVEVSRPGLGLFQPLAVLKVAAVEFLARPQA